MEKILPLTEICRESLFSFSVASFTAHPLESGGVNRRPQSGVWNGKSRGQRAFTRRCERSHRRGRGLLAVCDAENREGEFKAPWRFWVSASLRRVGRRGRLSCGLLHCLLIPDVAESTRRPAPHPNP